MIKSNLIIEDQNEFWFLRIPPVISIILIILFPPIFGTISLYPRLSSNKDKIITNNNVDNFVFIFDAYPQYNYKKNFINIY